MKFHVLILRYSGLLQKLIVFLLGKKWIQTILVDVTGLNIKCILNMIHPIVFNAWIKTIPISMQKTMRCSTIISQ
jgi:hypothetical protein